MKTARRRLENMIKSTKKRDSSDYQGISTKFEELKKMSTVMAKLSAAKKPAIIRFTIGPTTEVSASDPLNFDQNDLILRSLPFCWLSCRYCCSTKCNEYNLIYLNVISIYKGNSMSQFVQKDGDNDDYW